MNETTNPQPVQLQQKIFKSPKAAKPLQILVSLVFALDDLRAQLSEREARRFTTQLCAQKVKIYFFILCKEFGVILNSLC